MATKVQKAKAAPTGNLKSLFHGAHPEEILPPIRRALVRYYGSERRAGRKVIEPLKGRPLEVAVNRQMRFLHPGLRRAA